MLKKIKSYYEYYESFWFYIGATRRSYPSFICPPGCRTTDVQPPSQSDYQKSAIDSEELSAIDSDLGSIKPVEAMKD